MRGDQGFTLVELLVVMVVVAILTAVAVPAFLSQKSSSIRTQVLTNFSMMTNAIESCSAGKQLDGSYGGCTEHEELLAYEKGLAVLEICCPSGTVVSGTYDVNGVTADGTRRLTPVATDDVRGYELIAWVRDGDRSIWFQLIHWEDGEITKRCGEGLVLPPFDRSASSGVDGSRICTKGTF